METRYAARAQGRLLPQELRRQVRPADSDWPSSASASACSQTPEKWRCSPTRSAAVCRELRVIAQRASSVGWKLAHFDASVWRKLLGGDQDVAAIPSVIDDTGGRPRRGRGPNGMQRELLR